ncbi:MAG: hypothetical protein ABSB94_17280 [Syntrophorhabdales bacterium]|jgi:hypothetical protein
MKRREMNIKQVFTPLPFYEGEAPPALPVEGATLAPIIAMM